MRFPAASTGNAWNSLDVAAPDFITELAETGFDRVATRIRPTADRGAPATAAWLEKARQIASPPQAREATAMYSHRSTGSLAGSGCRPEPRPLLNEAREELAQRGWTLVRGVPFLRREAPDERAVLDFASCFGVPSARDGGRAVWPVAPVPSSPAATLSTRTGPAGFHTDAQYRTEPEDYVCLFGVRPAADGGETRLLRYDAAVAALLERRDGRELVASLCRPVWRWQVPAAFTATPRLSPPTAVLAGGGRIRWRRDNLEPTADVPADAATRIDAAFECAADSVSLALTPGDVLVIDNHRVMHARTAFTDPHRLLLRVRLWEAA